MAFGSADIRRSYLLLLLLLLLGSSLLTGLGGWAVWTATELQADASWLWTVLFVTLRVLGIGAVVILAPVISLTLINALAPVFNERPFFAGLDAIDPGRAESLRALEGLSTATAIGVGLRRLLRLVTLQLLAMLLAAVPLVGPILGPAFATAAAAYMVGWELLDPYYARLGLRFAEQAEQASAQRWAIMGFGLPFALAFAVPIVGPTLFAAAQAAVARLVVDALAAPAVFATVPAAVDQKT